MTLVGSRPRCTVADPLVNVPTTWLAQADSAIGGKVAIDLAAAKNGVGAFWPARARPADHLMKGSTPAGNVALQLSWR